MNFLKCVNRFASLSAALSCQHLRHTSKNVIRFQQRFKVTDPKVFSENKNPESALKGNLIYTGPMIRQIKMVKFMSLSSTLCGFAAQPYLISHAGGTHVAVIVAVATFVGFFTYVTPLLIHLITKNYVLEMYYQPPTTDNEQGVFTSKNMGFFLNSKYHKFTAADVEIPDIPGVFTSVLAKKVPLLFSPDFFTDFEAYKHLMGYDKPLDYKLYPQSTSKETQDEIKSKN
ncbi:hypothetical protein CHUAL_012502 [Chamberlinius hualienensis]